MRKESLRFNTVNNQLIAAMKNMHQYLVDAPSLAAQAPVLLPLGWLYFAAKRKEKDRSHRVTGLRKFPVSFA
jgi:hypothetical protein